MKPKLLAMLRNWTAPARLALCSLAAALVVGLMSCGSDLDPGEERPLIGDDGSCTLDGDWSQAWGELEGEVLVLVNQRRAAGADCGSKGVFGPAEPLSGHELLRCAARAHSMDMALGDYFDHQSPDGSTPGDRIELVGYDFSQYGENIAAGYGSASSVVAGWMGSPGHCANIMNPSAQDTGVGYYFDDNPSDPHGQHYWTQTFGRPRS